MESVVERLLDDISSELDSANNQLSEEQLADLRKTATETEVRLRAASTAHRAELSSEEKERLKSLGY